MTSDPNWLLWRSIIDVFLQLTAAYSDLVTTGVRSNRGQAHSIFLESQLEIIVIYLKSDTGIRHGSVLYQSLLCGTTHQ